jgi:hypothetical protein
MHHYREAEERRQLRLREQHAFDNLKSALYTLPVDYLQWILSLSNVPTAQEPDGFTRVQVYCIAAAIAK